MLDIWYHYTGCGFSWLATTEGNVFTQEKVHLIMNCVAFMVVTTSFLSWTDAVNRYYNKGNAKAHM